MESGELFSWGYNGNGQIDIGNNIHQLNPQRVTALQGVVGTSVVCGYTHTLAVMDEGFRDDWSANSYGQLGTRNKANLGKDELWRFSPPTTIKPWQP